MDLRSSPSSLIPEVIFEDVHLIVVSKPAGLLSQGEITGDANLVDWLRERLGRPYVGLVHRLDRNTSGLMVVAKRTKSAQRLTQALQSGEMERAYLAWVRGSLEQPVQWRHVLEKDPKRNLTRVVKSALGHGSKCGPSSRPNPGPKNPKEAILSAKPVGRGSWKATPLTLVEFVLETGRSHQIRAQASHEGYPLLGDAKYGGPDGFPRMALHSYRLKFPHPMSGEEMSFESPLPPDLKW